MKLIIVFAVSILLLPSELSSQMDRILYSLEKKHFFSSMQQTDQFILTVCGKSFYTAVIFLEIRSNDGMVIYHDEFTVDKFSEYGSTERTADDSVSIMNRLTHVLDDDNFSQPAIRDTSEMENNMLPRSIWRDIWMDPTAISFQYVISTENGRGITYSKKRKKVIVYYQCCS